MASLTIIGLSFLLLLLVYRYVLYPLFFSPLSKIPNAHYSAPLLPLWIRSKRRTGTAVRTLFALHEKHGPVIRLAPNEISVNSPDALRTVYIGGFEKHRWYLDAFVNFGVPNLVAMLEHKPHSIQKRMVSNVYSKSYLQNSKDLQTISDRLIFDRFLPIMQRVHEQGGELDVLDFTQAVGMDFTSAYLFGSSNGTNFMHDVEYRHHWLEEYKTFKVQLPRDRADGKVERWCFAMCEAAERFLHSENKMESPAETQPVVYARLTQSLRDSAKSDHGANINATIVTAASEMLDHLIAGHETSGITLSYLMYELSQRPDLQSSLRAQLRTLDPPIVIAEKNNSTDGIVYNRLPTPRSIDALPLLNNLLQETLRLYAAAPAQQPRITPFVPDGTTIEGYGNIPGGVMVSANAHSLHRNKMVFPEPEQWRPERWEEGVGKGEEMKKWFWAFGSGGRMCIGSHFAIQEMKLVIAAIYSNFSTEIVHTSGMEQAQSYIAGPVGGKCVLRFRRA